MTLNLARPFWERHRLRFGDLGAPTPCDLVHVKESADHPAGTLPREDVDPPRLAQRTVRQSHAITTKASPVVEAGTAAEPKCLAQRAFVHAAAVVEYGKLEGLGVAVEAHPVTNDDWWKIGKRAGPLRNAKMVCFGADLCIAVHRYVFNSKGTKDGAKQAIEAGIPTYLIDSEKAIPKRLLADDPRLE